MPTFVWPLIKKHNVVVVIEIGAYIHGVLILWGCLLSQSYGIASCFNGGYQVAAGKLERQILVV